MKLYNQIFFDMKSNLEEFKFNMFSLGEINQRGLLEEIYITLFT